MKAESPQLEARNLTFTIEGKTLLENVSLEFRPGLLYSILGPNGAGKSTLLKLLAGIWRATGGAVTWQGEEIYTKSRQEISRLISLVPQDPLVNFDFTVQEMVMMGRYPHDHHRENGLFQWSLETVDVWHLRHRSILKLSHGERKRVYIARSLISESPVLLLDEPTAGLDIRHQLEIWQLLRKLIDNGKIIVVSNHDLTAAKRFCHEVAVLNEGKCLSRGPFESVLVPPLLNEVFGVKEEFLNTTKRFSLK